MTLLPATSHLASIAVSVVVLGAAATIALVVRMARAQRITARWVQVMTVLCGLALAALAFLDIWSGWDHTYWRTHSLVTGLAVNVLILGLGYFAYEYGELRSQARLDVSLTAAGLGGIVDHLVDTEVALGLLCSEIPPDEHGWAGWASPGQPLRWLREHREWLYADPEGRRPRDPRRWPVALPEVPDVEWRLRLVDECVRRLLGAIRDWSPVVNTSRNGTHVLVALAELRKDLMDLQPVLVSGEDALPRVRSLRQRTRLLSYFLEYMSGADPLRGELVADFEPLGHPDEAVRWANEPSGEEVFGLEWNRALAVARARLRSPSADG